MKRIKKIIIWLIAIIAALSLAVVLLLNTLIIPMAVKAFNAKAPDLIGVPTSVESVSFEILKLDLDVKNFILGAPEGYTGIKNTLSFSQFFINIAPSSLLSKTIVINEVTIKSPSVGIEMKGLSTNNISQILDNLKKLNSSSNTSAATTTDQTTSTSSDESSSSSSGKGILIKKVVFEEGCVDFYISGRGVSLPLGSITLENIEVGGQNGANAFEEVITLYLEKIAEQIPALLSSAATGTTETVETVTNSVKNFLGL